MSILFESYDLCGITLRNRFVRSATWEGLAGEDGQCTEALIELMRRLAEGETGLLITSHAYVRKDGQAGPKQLGIYGDHLIGGLAAMAEAVHHEGGKAVVQLAHAGLFAPFKLTGLEAVCMSNVEGFGNSPRRVMTPEEISALTADFASAAFRAREAGFDGVQIHAAHGYLLSQSLSPAFNLREDEYGGPNRARFLMEVVRAIRDKVGMDFPILLKINCSDFLNNGLTLEGCLSACRAAAREGVCGIEISGGTFLSGDNIPSRTMISRQEKEAYFRDAAKALKDLNIVAVILVGGIRSYSVAEDVVREGYCDLVSMSRPFIREPHLVRRWRQGDRRKASCLSDNLCFGPARAGEGIYCVVERKGVSTKG